MGKDTGWLRKALIGNALYDVGKQLAGPLVISTFATSWQYLHHQSIDWWAILALFLLTSAVIYLNFRYAPLPTEAIEKAVEGFLARKGLLPEGALQSTPLTTNNPTHLAAAADRTFKGELFRVVRAPKAAFAEMTRDIFKTLGRADEFAMDVDILLEGYLVNISTEDRYIRDFKGTVEIDGQTLEMYRQRDFHAWEFNEVQFEYCLDPSPEKGHIQQDARSQTLTPMFEKFPLCLAPQEPLEGWVRFLIKDIDPEKLDSNHSYTFVITDSLGIDHSITRPATRPASGEITTRKKLAVYEN